MKKHTLIFFITILLFSLSPASIYAQETLPSGLKQANLAETIDAYIAENNETTAAVSLAVFKGDETLYQNHYGQMNIETGKKADSTSVYEWGSVSKLLVWVSVMQLWEKGQLDLNENIQNYLPENFFTKIKYDQSLTLLHLMNHNAGFEDTLFQMTAKKEGDIVPLEEALRRTEPHQIFAPGQVTAYSNWSTSLAGYIVERISGQSFSEYVLENIFQPLGMIHTAIEPDYADNPGVKEQLLTNQGYTSELIPLNKGLFYINLYPAGSTAGSLADFEIFAKALIPGAYDNKLLFENENTLQKMLSPSLTYPATDIDYINHGLWSDEWEVQTLGHGGNTHMYSSCLIFDPLSEIGMVIMTNQSSEFIYNYKLPQLVFGEKGAMAKTEGRTDLSEIEGLYYSARTIRKGIASMYTLSVLQPYFEDADSLSSGILGFLNVSAEEIAPRTLLLSQQLGDIELTSLARFSENNGIKKLSASYGESLEADSGVWAVAITSLLFLLAVVWSILMIVVSLLYWIFQKIRARKNIFTTLKKYEILTSLAILSLSLTVVLVGRHMVSFDTNLSAVTLNIIFSSLLSLVPIIYAVKLFKKWPQLKAGRLQKISYIITLVMGCTVPLTVVVLEMYRL